MKIKGLLYLLAISAVIFTFSCKDYEEELIQKQKEYEELLSETEKKDSAMLGLVTAFNEVEDNLQMIKEKEDIITSGMNEDNVPKDYKQRVMEDIQAIYTLMESNKAKIQELNEKLASTRSQLNRSNSKLDAATKQLAQYEKMVQSMTKQIEVKDAQIASLTKELMKLNISLDSVTSAYHAKSALAEEQQKELNKAYYVFDNKKALKENGIIEAKGGVIGIGSTKMLKDDFNKKYFTQINIQETKEINLYADKATVLTNHPSDSYSIEGADDKAEKIVIKDPVAFWSNSKYLVIQID